MKQDQVQQLLEQKADKIAGLRSIVVLTEDGLPDYSVGLDQDAADNRAALAATLGMTARRLAVVEDGGVVRYVLIEMAHGSCLIVSVGKHSHLVAAIESGVDMGLVGYELTMLAGQLAHALEAQPRMPAAREAEGARR
jgi:predicted regulator of Ras-like GTPase activity (Roadblock/LC7/MglB family)